MAGDLHEMSGQACLTKHSSLNVFFKKNETETYQSGF